MAVVNYWFCFLLVLAFAFINGYVCIKVDSNIPSSANDNFTTITTTISLNSQTTILPYKEIDKNKPDNITLLGDTELSASERTRRLIPYMAFYVPVSQLPINKQYATNSHNNHNNNNVHMTKQQQRQQQQKFLRPGSAAATGASGAEIGPTGNTHIPIPPQYVHTGGLQYLPAAGPTYSSVEGQNYQPNAGLGFYRTNSGGGGHTQSLTQYHLLRPSTTGHPQHLQPPGPPGPSALGVPAGPVTNKDNGNSAFLTFKEFKGAPIRHKTVQHFPPLSSTASSASSASAASLPVIKQHQQHNSHGGSGGVVAATADGAYRQRTKQQSKINLTPFTPSNSVPGNFVPIVYTPLSTNNNNNNLHATADEDNTSSIIFNHNENQQQQHQQQQYRKQQYIEYTSNPLPPSAPASAISVPLGLVPSPPVHSQRPHSLSQPARQQQQSQYFSVTTSPLSPANVDLTHDVGATNGGLTGEVVPQHAHHQHHNIPAISPPLPTTTTNIYQQNPQQHHHHQQETEHVITDATLRTSQQQLQQQHLQLIGTQQQRQQLYHDKSVVEQFQPPKSESFFESEIKIQQQQHNHHNIDQVLKDVNSYSIKSSHMMTPQEKYVMYLQQRVRYNKQQQQQQNGVTRQKYHEHNHKERERQQQQFTNNEQQHHNPTQIFVLSSTMSPPSAAAQTPLRLHQQHYDSHYPQQNPLHQNLYKKPNSNEGRGSGVGATGAGVDNERQEHILTIPVHSLFGDLETLQKQTHYSPTHSVAPILSHKPPYPKYGPSTSQHIDYLIDEPKQSLDDDHQQNSIQSQRNNQYSNHRLQPQDNQLELLKPTLGPPTHAFILVTTVAPPYPQDPVTQENYGSSLRPPYKIKPKLRLQSVLKENNSNYPANRQQNPTGRPQVVAITPAPKTTTSIHHEQEEDSLPKYVYIKEEFGQKIPTTQQGAAVKLKPSHRFESNDNQIPQRIQLHSPIEPPSPPQQAEPQPQSTSPASPSKTILADPNELPDIRTSSLAEILHKLQESNHLPHTLTPDNIDNSIKTLIRILNNLKQTQTIVANPPQHHETPAHHAHSSSPDYDYNTGSEEEEQQKQHQQQPQDVHILTPTGPNKHPGPSTGRPGIDYPNYAEIPETSFDCSQQRYKGFFGDPETNCQVWHYCDLNGGKASFLCPNGTIFSQIALTCDWWFNVKCATTPQLYVLNERLYKYILPFTPKFPEDYSGPLVDKYLAMKFQEMEEKMRLEKEKALREEAEASTAQNQQEDFTVTEISNEENHLEDTTTTEDNSQRKIKSHTTLTPPINHKHESVNSQVSEQSPERNLLIDDEVNDISQRGKPDDFESTTIATMAATAKSNTAAAISFSLKPIIVSSTLEPDYDEERLQHYDTKRSQNSDANNKITETTLKKAEIEKEQTDDDINDEFQIRSNSSSSSSSSSSSDSSNTEMPSQVNKMQITIEKVDVIEIKPDGASGHLIRDMLLNSKKQN